MTIWRTFLNDKIPDCGVAACCNAMLLWGTANPTDDEAKLADDQFSANDYTSKVLWGWYSRGIAGTKLGGFATITPSQLDSVISRFGCAFVVFKEFNGVGPHAVLAIGSDRIVSWGREYPLPALDPNNISAAFAIAPRFSPILIWYAITNNPRWFFLLSPLWWPQ